MTMRDEIRTIIREAMRREAVAAYFDDPARSAGVDETATDQIMAVIETGDVGEMYREVYGEPPELLPRPDITEDSGTTAGLARLDEWLNRGGW